MANLIRLKQIESGSALTSAANIGVDINNSVVGIISSSLSGALSILATDVEVAAVSASIAATDLAISSSTYSLNTFTSSIGLTIKNKLNTENVITSSHQLDGSVINNLTLGTTGDAYSLIVSGALAVVDADITISGSQYNVGGQIWVNGETGSAGNPPSQPYDNSGNPQADIIDQGEW